jgi:actin-related protein 6
VCRLFPNSLARIKGEKRTFVADELGSARDLSSISYRSPFDRVSLLSSLMSLRRPQALTLNDLSRFGQGYLMGWETEKPIWDRVFSRLAVRLRRVSRRILRSRPAAQGLTAPPLPSRQVEPEATSLFLTEPYNNPPALRAATDQMVFEHWGFRSLYSTTRAVPSAVTGRRRLQLLIPAFPFIRLSRTNCLAVSWRHPQG